jgi:hypothetical protein
MTSKRISTTFILIMMLSFAFSLQGCGNPDYTVTLGWDVPTNNTDGSPLNDLAGYELSIGSSPGNYSRKIIIPLGDKLLTCNNSDVNSKPKATAKCSYTVTGLKQGDYYLVVRAYNKIGLKSAYSNEVKKTAARIRDNK